jgi:hypothetical protein
MRPIQEPKKTTFLRYIPESEQDNSARRATKRNEITTYRHTPRPRIHRNSKQTLSVHHYLTALDYDVLLLDTK